MNHIARLTQDRDTARQTLTDTTDAINQLIGYLCSTKFAGPDNDFVHIRTDLMPKLLALRNTATA